MKEPRDIIENILRSHAEDYDLSEASGVQSSAKTREIVHLENGSNILVDSEDEGTNLEDMERYRPCQEVNFDALEVKEGFEKKKKKRNYIEFREEYMKVK